MTFALRISYARHDYGLTGAVPGRRDPAKDFVECKPSTDGWKPQFSIAFVVETTILRKDHSRWSGPGAGIRDPKVRKVFESNANHMARRMAVSSHEKLHRKHMVRNIKEMIKRIRELEKSRYDSKEECERMNKLALQYFWNQFNKRDYEDAEKVEQTGKL